LGWIKATYNHAIEFQGLDEQLSGYALITSLLGLLGLAFTCFIPLPSLFVQVLEGSLMALLFFAIWTLVGVVPNGLMFLFGVRLTVRQASDLPIIFDRKHRKVYRILREQRPGFAGLFKPWPIKACEYEWDLVDAVHDVEVVVNSATVSRNHHLMFAVRKSADDPTLIDSFQIANAATLSEELAPGMWEHIRRFMEEGGPHLPRRDEPLAARKPAVGWWASCGEVGFVGPRYREHWSEQFFLTLIGHIAFPICVPILLAWGTGNWLQRKTAIPVDWPEEVKRAVGPALRSGAGVAVPATQAS